MPILKKLPGRPKSIASNREMVLTSNHDTGETAPPPQHTSDELILPPPYGFNPFEDAESDLACNEREASVLKTRSLREGEALENELNSELHGGPKLTDRSRVGSPLRGTLERIVGSSPLRTLGKLSKGLRMTGRNVWSNTLPATPTSGKEKKNKKKKSHRRASEEIMTLLR